MTDVDAASAAASAVKEVLLQKGQSGQVVPHLAARADGTSYLARYSLNADSTYDIYVQKLNKSGKKAWGNDGIRASAKASINWVEDFGLATDAQGNAILAYTNTDDFVARAQKLDGRGALKWGADGVVLSSPGIKTHVPRPVRCSDGGVAVAWLEEVADSLVAKIQRLDGQGGPRWSAPFSISAPAGSDVVNVQLVPDARGSIFVAWVESPFNTPGDSFLQRLDLAGRPVWSEPRKINGTLQLPFISRPLLALDGQGGVYAAWTEVVDTMLQARVQHFDGNGTKSWDADGLLATNEEGMSQMATALTYVPKSSRLVLAWQETDPSQNEAGTLMQAFDAKGGKLWAEPGLVIVPADMTTGSAAVGLRPVGAGVALFYTQGALWGFESTMQVAAIRLTANAKPKVTTLSAVESAKQDAEVGELAGGGYWTVWSDTRSDATAIYGTWWAPSL